MLLSFKNKRKNRVSLIILFTLSISLLKAQDYYPYVIGYTSGESVLHKTSTDTFSVSFSGGLPVATQFKDIEGGTAKAMAGMRYDLVFASNAFDQDLFVSKGYFPDYIQLRWEIKRYQSSLTGYRVLRRKLGSGEAFLQVAFLSKDVSDWKDEFTESGVLYEYMLQAEGLFPKQQKFLNFLEGVGFRLPSGTVSGRVTYKGGAAVEGVSLIAETSDKFSGTSLYLNGTDAFLGLSPASSDSHFKFDTAFTFQTWLKPTSTSTSVIFQKGSQYKLTHSTGKIDFTAGSQTITVSFTQKADTFFHVSAVREKDSLKLYVMYEEGIYFSTKVKLASATPSNSSEIFMGKSATNAQYFQGYIDEVRIWYRALEQEEILTKSLMYIPGTDLNLSGYYRMNEGVGGNFYDLSRRGFTFNEQHGFIYKATWSQSVPFTKQLSVKGLTDKNGNYIISGVPYSSDGSTYSIVPIYLTHTFDPTQRLLFIGPGSNTFSDVNFTDVSSFPVQGYVYYNNTKFPVEGVQIKIDGRTAVTSEGNVITTDNKGYFMVDVPIGRHYLQMFMPGHGFKNEGKFPATPGSDFDFQSAYTIQTDFLDTTLVKVIGKVVGGPKQGQVVNGFGLARNNIGVGTLVFTTQKGYALSESGVNTSWQNTFYKNGVLTNVGATKADITTTAPKNITIQTSVVTGEFTAYLLPERYVLKSAGTASYTFDDSYLTTVDLTTKYINLSHKDTTLTDSTLLSNGTVQYNYRYDSTSYNAELDLIYRSNPPVITVTRNDGYAAFWDTTVTPDGADAAIKIVGPGGVPLTDKPVFSQRKTYSLKIGVVERYIHPQTNAIDDVPVTDGKVEIQNGLAVNTRKETYSLDEFGSFMYSFNGGLPNTTSPYLNTMTIASQTGKNQSITTNWTFNGSTFQGYLIGGYPVGNNFVTTGPNDIEMILRDPYGSDSYSSLEKGTTVVQTKTYETSNQSGVNISDKIDFGARVVTFAGVGAGVITETEQIANLTVGLEIERTFVDKATETSTTTTTKTWQTSDSPDFVGANGDLFIGNAYNLVYGQSVNIKFLKDTVTCSTCVGNVVSKFKIGKDLGLRISPEFKTSFMYTQYHIENNLIPNLIFLRNQYLAKATNFQSLLLPTNEDYGKDNTTGTFSMTGRSGGDSYNFTYPGGWDLSKKHYEDTVAFYNKQIKGWKDVLARNEREKLEADPKTAVNVSFDAGAKYESSVQVESSKEIESSYAISISPSLVGEIGFEALGLGMEVTVETKVNNTRTTTTGSTETSSMTVGYSLGDGDQGDYYSMDVLQPSSQTGPIFKLRGGQSSCPYAGQEVSKYYNAGTEISAATIQREVPEVASDNTIQQNVPEDQKAVFNLELRNTSQSGDASWFLLEVASGSNPNGALVSMDGSPIGNGRLINVPGASSLVKTITIEKVRPDKFIYDNIELILHSQCQPEDIADTIQLTARFQPVCSKVLLTQPSDKWLVNSATVQLDGTQVKTIPLNIGINGYNLAHAGFEKILVQYKASSSSQWISDMVYYVDQAQYTAAKEPKTYINNQPSQLYTLEMKSMQDRNYDVRVTSTCANGTTNSSTISGGIKDVKRPKLFGTPQPADGILSPGEDVSIQFDETIQAGLLISRNFQVKGVLNGAEIRHNSVVYLDGVDDYASVIAGPDLKEKDFTIEFWTQRANISPGIIYSQGSLEIGFNATNNIYVTFGSQTLTSSQTFTSTLDWMHFAVSYTNTDRKLNVFMNDKIPVENLSVTGVFEPTGRVNVGRSITGAPYYNGYIHELRVWEKAKGFGTVYANMLQTLSGSEVGLVGYWPMDDSKGSIATDKARSHHAILNGAAWAVFPRGYAMNFNGTSGYFTIPTGTTVVTNEMDMTIEFWFKAGKKPNQVLFSNGKGDQTDPTPPFNNIWVVGSDDAGKLYVLNNGSRLSVTKEVFDNEWHHLAVVVNRVANTTVFIDGNIESFQPSSNFGGFSGAKATLGARMFTSAGNVSYDRYFEGKIDEFRIWKLARTRQLLEMDMNSKLKGDEKGLLTYYPFDEYDVNLVLQANNSDQVDGSILVPTAFTGTSGNLDIPNIKDARPVQNVAYDWVVNGDKIILNIKEPANLVEKVVLEFTVEDIEDVNENILSSPITWTAYVKKNTVIWNSVGASFEKKLYDPLSFDLEVLNIGGTEQNYEITDLPAWLSVDAAKGTLGPDSKKTVKLTVSPSINLGSYEESVFLSSDFGFKEKFDLKLKVFGDKPNWVLDASKYQYNMSIIGTISINGTVSTNPDDMIAAFVNDTLRGVTNLKYVPEYDMYMFFMDVFSNKPDGELVKFKVWNAAKGKVHVDVESDKAFVKDAVIGMPSKPQEFKVIDNISSPYILEKGWNWVSFNLNSKALKNSSLLFSELNSAEGDLIKGMGKFDQFGTLTGWLGEITGKGGFNLKDGYKLKVATADTFHLVGQGILIDTVNISLKTGWNWIGYPSQLNMDVNDALANVNFDNGDFIKGQRSFAYYDKFLGWIGSLKFLSPQEGYMLQTKLPHNLTYPNPELLFVNSRKAQQRVESSTVNIPWNLKPSEFANSMSVMLSLNLCREAIDTTNDFLGAFAGSECRGLIQPKFIPAYNEYVFFMTVYSNSPSETITLKYFDGSLAKEFQVKEPLSFANDQILGTVASPFKSELVITNACQLLSVNDTDTESNAFGVEIYPNPFTDKLKISLNNVDYKDVELSIADAFGHTVASPKMKAGVWEWNAASEIGGELSAGVYLLTVKQADKTSTFKLIKQ